MTPIDVTMPRLSDSMEEGTVLKWLVEVGAEVGKGQPLVEIETDKATMEYEAESAGTLLEILVAEGETASIGAPIARLDTVGEAPRAPSNTVLQAPAAAQDAAPRPSNTVLQGQEERGGRRVNASPIAKRMAKELGVDLAQLEGTGPQGMITKEDVERAAQPDGAAAPAAESAPPSAGAEPLTRVQQAVVRHMIEAATVPTFAAEVEIDMTACTALRESLDPRPSFNDLVVKACALALREHARVNAAYTENGFRYSDRVHVGIAVAAENALLVPVIHDADGKSLAEIAAEARNLAAKARDGKLTPPELDGGTFTVSNLGMHGVRRFEALLNTPQAAILAVGAVEARPAVVDRELSVRPLMSATLVCDHRILYGADGARFLTRVRELLEDPASL